MIILEPEAAALYALKHHRSGAPLMSPGDTVMIVDAGGGAGAGEAGVCAVPAGSAELWCDVLAQVPPLCAYLRLSFVHTPAHQSHAVSPCAAALPVCAGLCASAHLRLYASNLPACMAQASKCPILCAAGPLHAGAPTSSTSCCPSSAAPQAPTCCVALVLHLPCPRHGGRHGVRG